MKAIQPHFETSNQATAPEQPAVDSPAEAASERIPRPVNLELAHAREAHARDIAETIWQGDPQFARQYWENFDRQTWQK